MRNTLKTFIVRSLILTVIVGGVGAGLFSTILKTYYLNVFPFMLAGFLILTVTVHGWLIKALLDKNTFKFGNKFLLSLGVKFLIYFTFVVIYMFSNRDNIVPFIIVFIFLYLIYTTFEVVSLVKTVKKFEKM